MLAFAAMLPDCNFYPRPPRGGRLVAQKSCGHIGIFLSTPSARRATLVLQAIVFSSYISIHALREEGDSTIGTNYEIDRAFLSTPSARRATAKTEKNISAFVSL